MGGFFVTERAALYQGFAEESPGSNVITGSELGRGKRGP
jgi:hypothetical protein